LREFQDHLPQGPTDGDIAYLIETLKSCRRRRVQETLLGGLLDALLVVILSISPSTLIDYPRDPDAFV